MQSRFTAAAAAVIAAGALALAGCSSTAPEATTAPETDEAATFEPMTVTVGTLTGQPHFYQPFLYQEFAPEGLTIEVVTFKTTPELNQGLEAGSIDFAITGVTPTITSVAGGVPLKIVASAADGGSGFIGNDTVASIDDLPGKNVAFLQGSAQSVVMYYMLEEAGIDPAEVNLLPLPASDIFSQWNAGDVDAFFGVEIGASLALNAGGQEFADPYSTPIGKVNIGLVTTDAFIEEHPDVTQAVVDTHAATVEWMTDNIDEWLPTMVETYGGDEAVFRQAMENFWLRADLSTEYQEQLTALAEQMVALDLISEAPAIEDLTDPQFAG